MTRLDRDLLAERALLVQRHLARVVERLPADVSDFRPATDASDAVILHFWQATQVVIDLATAACVRLSLGTPTSYADAFAKLAEAGALDRALAARLSRAAGFRNVVAHAYENLDMARVFRAATAGPADLLAFFGALGEALPR